MRGGQWNSVSPTWASLVKSSRTGPGRPVEARWKASATRLGISSGEVTRNECFTNGMVEPTMSASWKASVPMEVEPTWPVMATMGTESMWASPMAVTRLVAPGPEVATQTPTPPVAMA